VWQPSRRRIDISDNTTVKPLAHPCIERHHHATMTPQNAHHRPPRRITTMSSSGQTTTEERSIRPPPQERRKHPLRGLAPTQVTTWNHLCFAVTRPSWSASSRQEHPIIIKTVEAITHGLVWTNCLYKHLRTMCGSRTGGWSLPCVMSD
jgi:hypothetical protein